MSKELTNLVKDIDRAQRELTSRQEQAALTMKTYSFSGSFTTGASSLKLLILRGVNPGTFFGTIGISAPTNVVGGPALVMPWSDGASIGWMVTINSADSGTANVNYKIFANQQIGGVDVA